MMEIGNDRFSFRKNISSSIFCLHRISRSLRSVADNGHCEEMENAFGWKMVLFYFYFHFVLFGFSVRRSTGFPFRNTHQQLDLSMWCGNRSRRVSGECVLRVRMHSLRSFDWDTVVHRQIRFRTVSWRWRTQRYVQTTALHTTRESGRCFKLTRIFETPLIPIHTATHSIGHRSTVGVRVYSVDFSFWQIQYLLCRGGYVVMLKHRLRCTDHLLSGISQRCSMLGARGFYVFYQHEKIHSISSPVFFLLVFIRRHT